MRYFIDGLQGDIQAYVSLQRPKTLQQAESHARMKHAVNQKHGLNGNQAFLIQIEFLLSKFSTQLMGQTKPVAALTPSPSQDHRLEVVDRATEHT